MIPTPNPSPREGRQKPTPLFLTEGRKDTIPTPDPIPERSSPTRSLSPREGSVDGWGKYGLRSSLLAFKTKWRKKGQNKSAQGNALGIVRNQHSPRMGKRIIIPLTPFASLQWWGVILLPPSGAYPCCILSPRALPGAGISMPHSGRNLDTSVPPRRCLGLSRCWPFFLHFVLKASKLERRPCRLRRIAYPPEQIFLSPSLGVIDRVA